MMKVTMMMMMIIVTLKGAIQDFYNLHTASPTVANMYAQVARAQCPNHATHRALITCSVSCATCCKGTAQLLSLAEFKLHVF